MVQILAGLITYLLLAIYCHEEHGERASIKRVRELRTKILNETREREPEPPGGGRKRFSICEEVPCNFLTGHCWIFLFKCEFAKHG